MRQLQPHLLPPEDELPLDAIQQDSRDFYRVHRLAFAELLIEKGPSAYVLPQDVWSPSFDKRADAIHNQLQTAAATYSTEYNHGKEAQATPLMEALSRLRNPEQTQKITPHDGR